MFSIRTLEIEKLETFPTGRPHEHAATKYTNTVLRRRGMKHELLVSVWLQSSRLKGEDEKHSGPVPGSNGGFMAALILLFNVSTQVSGKITRVPVHYRLLPYIIYMECTEEFRRL